jgi:hypothetical protein
MQRNVIDQILITIGIISALALLAIGGLSWSAYAFTTANVHNELASQQIFFPPKGSPALSPAEFPDLQQYAGQQVIDGPTAKAYANGFIARHLQKIGGGKTYSEVSAEAQAQPQNQQLAKQAQTLFQGETLRGLLLGDGYGFWVVGRIAEIAAIVAFVAGGIMAVLVILGLVHLRRRQTA